MDNEIKWVTWDPKFQIDKKEFSDFDLSKSIVAHTFHKRLPNFKNTPLHSLKNLATKLGVSNILVKDEGQRFNLKAFKALGASFAIANYIAEKLGKSIEDVSYDEIVSEETKDKLGDITFVTATDGNHGRAVAWTAKILNQKSVVYMPKGSSEARLQNILSEGAQAYITDMSYDDCVSYANKKAQSEGWVLIQDTAWDSYTKIPIWIMQGYTSLMFEVFDQVEFAVPTHVFLQAGVGSFASSVAAFISSLPKIKTFPKIIIVEPHKANCFYKTAKGNDGKIKVVTGDMDSIMAGLCCGVPSPIAWNILSDVCSGFVSIPDSVTKTGMRVLAKPFGDDPSIVSGESGACTLGLVYDMLSSSNADQFKNSFGIDTNSNILCISTEADTDVDNYKNIINS